MGKRVTLTDREVEYIVEGLKNLKNAITLDYQVIKTGQQVYQDIIDKLAPTKGKDE